jgi:hypothetical protein
VYVHWPADEQLAVAMGLAGHGWHEAPQTFAFIPVPG